MKFKTSLNYNMGYYITKRITPLRTAQFITMKADVTGGREGSGSWLNGQTLVKPEVGLLKSTGWKTSDHTYAIEFV